MLTTAELQTALETRDLTDPAQGPHAIHLITGALPHQLDLWRIGRAAPSSEAELEEMIRHGTSGPAVAGGARSASGHDGRPAGRRPLAGSVDRNR